MLPHQRWASLVDEKIYKEAGGIEDFLSGFTRLRQMTGEPTMAEQHGWKYENFNDMILKEGKRYQPSSAELPEGLKGPMQECFRNAWLAAKNIANLTYVEGFAAGSMIPVHHAWVTSNGRDAIEVTWDDGPGTEYYGIAFDTDWVTSRIMRRGYTGVFGEMMDREAQEWFKTGLPPAAKA